MKLPRSFLIVAGMLMMAACGAPKNIFVLVPDPGGKVGQITIRNDTGQQTLTTAGAIVEVKNVQTAQQQRQPLTSHKIQTIFQDAIGTRPRSSLRHILYFEYKLSRLTESSKKNFTQIANRIIVAVNDRNPCDIRVVGHTDTTGSDEYNTRLGLARARKIAQKLIELGILSDQIDVASHGEKDLFIPTSDNTLEPRNRRVEVIVH